MTTEKSYKEFYSLFTRLGYLKSILNVNYGLSSIGFGFIDKEKMNQMVKVRKEVKKRLNEDFPNYKISEKIGDMTIYLN